MSDYDNTNTALAFVDNGLFCAEGVQAKGRSPILTIKVNFDGIEKEIGLWFSTDKETGQYRITKNGSKMLTGKIKEPYAKPDEQSVASPPPAVNGVNQFDDDIPF